MLHYVEKVEKLIFSWNLPEVNPDDYSGRTKVIINPPSVLLMKMNEDIIASHFYLTLKFDFGFKWKYGRLYSP